MAKAKNRAIEIRQGAAGKHAYVGPSRIRVVDIAVFYGIMLDELVIERLQRAYPQLTSEQIADAIEYWRNNKKEIEREIEADEAALSKIPTPGPETYVVRQGDTFEGIADQQLGDSSRWPEILALNRNQLQSADQIAPGQVLVLPA